MSAKPRGYISRAELLAAALKDPEFKAHYDGNVGPFSGLLAEMRTAAGLTQEQVAALAGVGRPLVSMLESGTLTNSRWSTMTAIAKACGFRLVMSIERMNGQERETDA